MKHGEGHIVEVVAAAKNSHQRGKLGIDQWNVGLVLFLYGWIVASFSLVEGLNIVHVVRGEHLAHTSHDNEAEEDADEDDTKSIDLLDVAGIARQYHEKDNSEQNQASVG